MILIDKIVLVKYQSNAFSCLAFKHYAKIDTFKSVKSNPQKVWGGRVHPSMDRPQRRVWQRCHSPRFKSVNRKNDFETIILRQKKQKKAECCLKTLPRIDRAFFIYMRVI